MAVQQATYSQIMSDLGKGAYSPVYYLMGEEPFFIDTISEYIREHALKPEERDFNQLVVYGNDITMQAVVERARAYPMGAERQVIIVREAQNLMRKDSDNEGQNGPGDILSSYLQSPNRNTILVFCHKNGKLDGRLKVAGQISKAGVLFESKKVREEELPSFIQECLNVHGKVMSPKGMSMMAESVGTDLCRLNGELEKLVTAMPADVNEISPEFIESLVGISKDFNLYEFQDAIINRNIYKANQIAAYYESNAKTYPIQLITATLFSYFSNLMLAHYSPDKSDHGVAGQLGLKSTWVAKNSYLPGMKNYSAGKTLQIIAAIRRTDARSKGVGTTGNGNDGLLRELLFFILH
mgnify:CR=1 FL=1